MWGREGPGVPRIILPSPGGRGCPLCLLVVGDGGAPARKLGAPLLREGPLCHGVGRPTALLC